MREAADIGGDNHLGLPCVQVIQFACLQRTSDLGLQDGVGAGRAAAQVSPQRRPVKVIQVNQSIP